MRLSTDTRLLAPRRVATCGCVWVFLVKVYGNTSALTLPVKVILQDVHEGGHLAEHQDPEGRGVAVREGRGVAVTHTHTHTHIRA